MARPRVVALIVAAGVLITTLVVWGCSSNSSIPMAPTQGSGGGTATLVGGGRSGNTPFDSGTLIAPANFEHTFPKTGTVGYHCKFHQNLGMLGTVNVSPGGDDSAQVVASGTTFTPVTVTVKPGGIVRWSVIDGTHTVTSD